MGIGVAILGILTALTGVGLLIAGIVYVGLDWGTEDKGEKARLYSLLIAGIIIVSLAVAGMSYYLLKPSTLAKNTVKSKSKK